MSTAPDPVPQAGTRFTLDDAVAELKKLVDVAEVQRDLLRGFERLLAGPGPAPPPAPPPGAHTPSPVPVPPPAPRPSDDGAAAPTPPPAPPGGRAPGPPVEGLVPLVTTAVGHLARLAESVRTLVDLTRATNYLLGAGGRAGGAVPGVPASGLGALFKRYFGRHDPHDTPAQRRAGHPVAPARGLGAYLGRSARRAYHGSRIARGRRAGRHLGRGLGKTLGGGGKTLGAVGGALGAAAGGAVALVSAFQRARASVVEYTDKQLELARQLSQVSGGMAGVTAMREVHQMERDIQRGEATAGTASRLEAAEARRKNEENQLDIAIDNATNRITAYFSDNLITPFLAAANDGVKLLKMLPLGIGETLSDLLGPSTPTAPEGLLAVARRAEAEGRDAEAAAAEGLARARRAAPDVVFPAGGPPGAPGPVAGGRLP